MWNAEGTGGSFFDKGLLIKGVFLFVVGLVMVSTSFDRIASHPNGLPLESIDVGSYSVVGSIEVSKDKQQYYQMILEQEGKVKLYTLPKDMIIRDTSSHRTGLEVVEKAGLKKAVLYELPPSPTP